MVINISFIEKNVRFTNCKNVKILEDLKLFFSKRESLDLAKKTEVLASDLENDGAGASEKQNQFGSQSEAVPSEVSGNDNSATKILKPNTNDNTIVIADRNSEMNFYEFIKELAKNKEIFSPQFVGSIKLDKKFLVLPDELIAYDCVTLPSLKPWKLGEALKLRLSVDYKDFGAYNFTYKNIAKTKQSSVFAIELVNQRQVNKILNIFKKYGIKVKGASFYSSCLTNFYTSHVVLSKFGSVVVRLDKNHTTILAISHGFLVASYSIACGYEDILAGASYKQEEFSKKMTAYKYICYELSNKSEESKKQKQADLSIEEIEKAFPTAKTNLLAPMFQVRNASGKEVIKQKIFEMLEYLKESDLQIYAEKVIIDTESQEAFDALKLQNSIRIDISESEIFDKIKPNPLLKVKKVSFLRRLKWKK